MYRKRSLLPLITLLIALGIYIFSKQNTTLPTALFPTITPLPSAQLQSATDSAQVLRVIDGDTIVVTINSKTEKVRLIGVDTPETVDPRKQVQCFGKEASAFTKQLLTNQTITLESDITQENRDKYKRLLRYVYLPDGTNVNKKIIADGYGFEYTYQIPYRYQQEFKEAQRAAREQKRGLWADGACPR